MTVLVVDPARPAPDPATTAFVPVEELRATIARLERMQSIGAGILSNATVALRTLRAHVPPPA